MIRRLEQCCSAMPGRTGPGKPSPDRGQGANTPTQGPHRASPAPCTQPRVPCGPGQVGQKRGLCDPRGHSHRCRIDILEWQVPSHHLASVMRKMRENFLWSIESTRTGFTSFSKLPHPPKDSLSLNWKDPSTSAPPTIHWSTYMKKNLRERRGGRTHTESSILSSFHILGGGRKQNYSKTWKK